MRKSWIDNNFFYSTDPCCWRVGDVIFYSARIFGRPVDEVVGGESEETEVVDVGRLWLAELF